MWECILQYGYKFDELFHWTATCQKWKLTGTCFAMVFSLRIHVKQNFRLIASLFKVKICIISTSDAVTITWKSKSALSQTFQTNPEDWKRLLENLQRRPKSLHWSSTASKKNSPIKSILMYRQCVLNSSTTTFYTDIHSQASAQWKLRTKTRKQIEVLSIIKAYFAVRITLSQV